MSKQYKAVVRINGSDTVLECSPEIAIDGQKVMLVRETGEQIRGQVSGRNLGVRETVLGVGRVKDGKISIHTNSGPITVKIEVKRPQAYMKKMHLHKIKTIPITKKAGMKMCNKAPSGLVLKAVKD